MRATWPKNVRWQSAKFWIEGQSLDPTQSISGAETIVPTMRGRWLAQATLIFWDEAAVLEWQGFLAMMEGKIGTVLLPAFSKFRPLDINGNRLRYEEPAGFSNSQAFEHWGFDAAPVSRATVSVDAALRSTRLSISLTGTTGVRPGQVLGIGERSYRVQAAWSEALGTQSLMIQPPLREAVLAGAEVELARPVCRMRFASEAEGVMDDDLSRLKTVTVNFKEAV
ncbi:hypothetical protein [Thioclava kandeliae]|uniref:TIGR02217 family protein n=1 Tax=Thioclava kandeliae TaxID=3070818 RepID=A0ABV1SIE2_9RHOB